MNSGADLWILFSLLTAIMLSTSDAVTKMVLVSRDEYLVAWMRLLFSLPLLIIVLVLVEIPNLDMTFWIASLIALPLEVIAVILYTRALKVSPISISIPFLTLTPVFLIIVSYFLLGEKITPGGGAGILLIAIGGYMLNIHEACRSPLAPVRAALKERGVVLMIVVALIFSITSTLGKMAIEHSSPLFFGGFYFILVTILFTPVAIRNSKGGMAIRRKEVLPLILIGLTFSLMIIFHMIAISLTKVAYMISIKRMSLFFSILYGYFLFQEKNIRERTFGSVLMFAGFLLIVFAS